MTSEDPDAGTEDGQVTASWKEPYALKGGFLVCQATSGLETASSCLRLTLITLNLTRIIELIPTLSVTLILSVARHDIKPKPSPNPSPDPNLLLTPNRTLNPCLTLTRALI